MPIFIRKVSEPYGWLGNMSPYPITYEGTEYRTSEALFQSLRFDDSEIINLIKEQKSPMGAKMVTKKHKNKMIIKPMSDDDLDNMRKVLNLKIAQYPELQTSLANTRDEAIIEDCTKRPGGSGLFWGAALKDDAWVGHNWLGKIWMEIRDKL